MEAALGKISTTIKSQLSGLKTKAMDLGKKKVMEYKDKIPTQDQVAEKLKSSGCSAADKKRLEAKYNKLKNFLNKVKSIIGAAAAGIAALSAALAMLNGLLTILDTIIKVLNVIIKILNIIIKVVKIVVKFLGGTFTGGAIDTISRLIAKTEYKIQNWIQVIERAKEFVSKMLKKYINPISKFLAKAAAILAGILGAIEGIIMIMEMLYMFVLSKCAADEENKTSADTNINEDLGLGNGTEGDQLAALNAMLQVKSPEEIMARLANTGNTEYIHHITNANFETIGYKRFNAAVKSLDSLEGREYPSDDDRLHYKDNNKLYHEKLYENNNNEDLDEGLPEFPDLVRGRQKENILRKNLKINPKGPKPDDYRSS